MKSARMCGNLRCNGREATARLSNLWIALCLLALAEATQAQTLGPAQAASPSASPEEETIIPTFETQKLARTYILDVPAPRRQITDRNGAPLAQNRLSHNLVINFPTPLDFSDAQALSYTREKIDEAAKSIGRRFRISDETILRHYRNRGIMPFEIAQNLSQQEYENIKDAMPDGAMVVIDPNNGDILALASWPTYDPNVFVPSISADQLKALQDDKDIPLLPRAYRSSYPPGSTFKIAVGIAALESHAVYPDDRYECVPSIQVGNVTFHNWKKGDRGALNFVQALTESCDTWFYQVGIKTSSGPIIDWALKLGFGAKCGIPLRGEAEGRIPNDEYMKATHGRKILNGDIANMSIGQGDIQVTPLQMAQAMGVIANGGTLHQTRLVQQVQTFDNQIVAAYQVRAKRTLDISSETLDQLRTGMIDVVNGAGGTAHQASLDNVEVAGKTGTAQWGPKNKERTAAWFAGFMPVA